MSDHQKIEAEKWREALSAATERGRQAGLREAASIHDAEIERLQKQIEENDAYCERQGKDPFANGSNRLCRDKMGVHEYSAAAIRALIKEGPSE
jgi:hypothetical protein